MTRKVTRAGLVLLVFGLSCVTMAAWADDGKIGGYFIGDYYYVVDSHDVELKDSNGFQFRRIYLQYDKGLDDAFSVRLRFEMNSPDLTKEKAKLVPFVKHGYLKWKHSEWRTTTYFGLSGTPTWGVIEGIWGYRSVAKTLLDLQKIGSSTDFGVAVKGTLDEAKKISYHAMVGNGSSTSSETNQQKRAYLSLTARPADGVIVEAYGDWDNKADDKDRITVQGFLAYQQETFRVGVQAANQTRKQGEGEDDVNLLAGSAFGAVQMVEKKLWAFGRLDRMFDPNPDGGKIAYTPYDATAASNTVIAGLDWTPIKNVHIIPNVFLVLYDDPDAGDKPDTDIMPRLTVYYRY